MIVLQSPMFSMVEIKLKSCTEDVQEWESLRKGGMSWNGIARKYSTTKDTVRGRVNRRK